MATIEKLDEAQIKKSFDKFDYNGNGVLSLAEIDRAVLELYPQFAKNKRVIMRAYKAADVSKDEYIELNEFNRLIEFLYYYDELYQLFKKLDKNNDNRISLQEFKQGHKLMGLEGSSNTDLKKAFDEIDVNHGGYILFDEFCIYAAKKKLNAKMNPPKPSSRPTSVVGSVKGSRPASVVGSVTGSVTGSTKQSSIGSKGHESKGSVSGLNVVDDATSVTSMSEFADFARDDIVIKSLYKLSEDLTNFLTKSKEFDVKIIIGKESDIEEFHAHSFILQARSAYFNAALSKKSGNKTDEDNSSVSYIYSALFSFMGDSDNADDGHLTIFKKENISPKIFKIILDYIYGGAVGIIKINEFASPEFLDLLETCEELGIQGFSEYLQPIFLENHHGWIQENLLTLEKFSSKREAFHEIRRYCLDQLCQNPDIILKSEDLAPMDKRVLLDFLSRDDLIANEIDLWNFIIKWGITQDPSISREQPAKWPREDFDKLKAIVNDLIPLIRFKWITSDLFYQQVRPYKWLFEGDTYENLMETYMMGNSQTNTPILQNPPSVLPKEPKAREKSSNLIINENPNFGSLISSYIDRKPFKADYPSYVFKTVYRGTTEHFSCASFHEKCGNLANTLTIARIRETGELIGGYNPEKWKIAGRSVNHAYPIESKKAFIFKIDKDKLENSKISRVQDSYNALRYKKDTGPNFGDLIICNKSPIIYYEHRFYEKELKINGGSLDDFEVYRVFPKQKQV